MVDAPKRLKAESLTLVVGLEQVVYAIIGEGNVLYNSHQHPGRTLE